MKSQNISLCFVLLALITLLGCSSSSVKMDKLPGIEVKPDKINTDFIIFEDPVGGSANTHKNNAILIIRVENLVDSQIEFSSGFVSLYRQTDSGWAKIDNLMKRPEATVRLPTTKEFPPGMDVSVIPWVPGLAKSTPVRIFFDGQNVGTGETVGAYMDFELLP